MLIRLTEVTKSADKLKTQPVLVNADSIVLVNEGPLETDSPHIIGLSTIETIRRIGLSNGRGLFVQETIEEIEALVAGQTRGQGAAPFKYTDVMGK